MTFEKILEVYSERLTEKHLYTVGKVKDITEKLGKICTVIKATDLQKSCFRDINLVITAGGDGTFIRAAHYLKDTPIIGVNSEPEISEGGLTSLNEDELSVLEKILQGDCKIVKKQRARVRRNNVVLDEPALNEVYVGTEAQFHTSRYTIELNGEEEEQRSSGVVIATGSGSSAWYKSAGGIPFPYHEEKLKFLVREPFVSRIFKPTLLSGEVNKDEKIIFKAGRYNGGIIAIDSHKTYNFNVPDIVEVYLANLPLNVIMKNEERE